MAPVSNRGRTTDPRLLDQVRDWEDGAAWLRFVARYEPHLRAVCRHHGLVGDAADECGQQVWIRLAARMRTFRYDPGRRFRGWLHLFFDRRVKDFLKSARGRHVEVPLTEIALDGLVGPEDDGEPCDSDFLALLARAEAIQAAVRVRVKPEVWQAYWRVAIDGDPVDAVAGALGRSYAMVYQACERVRRMLAEEGRRRGGLSEGGREHP